MKRTVVILASILASASICSAQAPPSKNVSGHATVSVHSSMSGATCPTSGTEFADFSLCPEGHQCTCVNFRGTGTATIAGKSMVEVLATIDGTPNGLPVQGLCNPVVAIISFGGELYLTQYIGYGSVCGIGFSSNIALNAGIDLVRGDFGNFFHGAEGSATGTWKVGVESETLTFSLSGKIY